MKAIILAGGNGTRLWPLSNAGCPKQFLDFGSGESLIQKTVNRLKKAVAVEDLLVVTSEKFKHFSEIQVGELECLLEPAQRNTAPAVLLSLKYLIEFGGLEKNDICFVSPSDLYFSDENEFLELLAKGSARAQKGSVVTFGIRPSYPETAYGYIHAASRKFVEKPDRETAHLFLKKGGYLWNSGVFLFQLGHLLDVVKQVAPEFFMWFSQPYAECYRVFSELPSVSFDHAFMEKTDQVAVLQYTSDWSDLGSWDRLYRALTKDHLGNVTSGSVDLRDTENSLVFSVGKKIVTVGMEDIIVVETDDAILVTQKGKEKEIAACAKSEVQEEVRVAN